MVNEPVSRRSFFTGLGGGVAASALVWGAWRYRSRAAATVGQGEYPILDRNYVEYGGWILTRIEKERMLAEGVFK
jgi:hypothetical protein